MFASCFDTFPPFSFRLSLPLSLSFESMLSVQDHHILSHIWYQQHPSLSLSIFFFLYAPPLTCMNFGGTCCLFSAVLCFILPPFCSLWSVFGVDLDVYGCGSVFFFPLLLWLLVTTSPEREYWQGLGASFSVCELLSVLYFFVSNRRNKVTPVLSKGHAASMQYACLYALNTFSSEHVN